MRDHVEENPAVPAEETPEKPVTSGDEVTFSYFLTESNLTRWSDQKLLNGQVTVCSRAPGLELY